MRVTLIAYTTVLPDAMVVESGGAWEPEEPYDDAAILSEFAGRQCYESWNKPNPATATNEGYIGNIINQKHYSVMEHGVATVRVSGVSRSLTHELVRHRHHSYSQLSQRFCVVDNGAFVIPPLYANDVTAQNILQGQWEAAVAAYDALVARWLPILLQRGVDTHRARKMAREAARAVLPNMTPTAIVVTGNHRAWREMLEKRGTIHADAEIRMMALRIFQLLVDLEPNLYQDFSVTEMYGEKVLTRGNG